VLLSKPLLHDPLRTEALRGVCEKLVRNSEASECNWGTYLEAPVRSLTTAMRTVAVLLANPVLRITSSCRRLQGESPSITTPHGLGGQRCMVTHPVSVHFWVIC
jgi:hypothetical protein